MTSEGASSQPNFPAPHADTHWHPDLAALTIETAQRELNANAISVYSYAGSGLNGHLTLTVSPAVYLTIAGEPYVLPLAPPVEPVFPTDTPTDPQITEANRLLPGPPENVQIVSRRRQGARLPHHQGHSAHLPSSS